MRGERSTGRIGLTLDRARKLIAILRAPEYRAALRRGVAASTEHAGVPFFPAATVIDIGANRGQFAVFARSRFPVATVIAFEPHPEALRTLRRVTAGDELTRVYDTALGTHDGNAMLHLSHEDDSSSLLIVGDTYLATWPSTYTIGSAEVRLTRLDEVVTEEQLREPVLLKIDVQGTELDVLQGADGILHRINEIFVECSFIELYEGQALADDVIVFLCEHGFRLAGMYTAAYDASGRCLQADLLFHREESLPR